MPTQTVSAQRIIALDILRGYFILVIASIHLAYYPSLLGVFDGRGDLWTSEAEGFFFISGLLIGIIRRNDLIKRGYRVAATKLLQRGWKLYLTSGLLSLGYLLVGRLAAAASVGGLKDGLDLDDSLGHVVTQIATLHYTYGWADFLVYYAAYLFIAPVVLWLLAKRRWWLVVSLSLGVWFWRWSGDRGWINPFIQWQVYFFLGCVIGYYWQELTLRFAALSQPVRRRLQWAVVSLSGLIYVVGMVLTFVPAKVVTQVNQNHTYSRLLTDGRIGLLRPLILLITIAAAFIIIRHYQEVIVHRLGWLLVPFGQNSLYVYIMESLFLFAIPIVVHPTGSFAVNTALELITIGGVWLAVRNRFLFRIIPR